jgi:hypothetical protein
MNARLGVFLLVCTLSLQGQKAVIHTPTPQSAPRRYQLVSLEVDDQGSKSHNIFLLDSKTGRVWRYQPLSMGTTKDDKPIKFPEVFLPIEIWQPKEGVTVSPSDN